VVSAGNGTAFDGAPTARVELKSASGSTTSVEISETLAADIERRPALSDELRSCIQTLSRRLQGPCPNVFVTLHGMPLAMKDFAWPYHRSTSGADSWILHGIAQLASDASPLHAKVSASLTVTFAEVLPALEQPYAESVTYNAIRKTLDLGQLELLKSGNRQPAPVTTRYYSFRRKCFVFSETSEAKRRDFLRGKVFWTSERLGGGQPVWIADPYDAQYLDASSAELIAAARSLASEGLLTLDSSGEFASATEKLKAQTDEFTAAIASALAMLKPKFNEEMRAGHTNM
jgi:hypothetical protein